MSILLILVISKTLLNILLFSAYCPINSSLILIKNVSVKSPPRNANIRYSVNFFQLKKFSQKNFDLFQIDLVVL